MIRARLRSVAVRWVVVALAFTGCYRAHREVAARRPDAGRDTGRPDGPDAARPDAARSDAGPLDAGRTDCGSFELRDRTSLTWLPDAIGCSQFLSPGAVALAGRVHLVAAESRFCRDRTAFTVAARASVRGDALSVPLAELRLPVEGTVSAASTGDLLGVCTGLSLTTVDADYRPVVVDARLAPRPVSTPGCSMDLRCEGLAGSGDRWLARLDGWECDAFYASMSVNPLDGSPPMEALWTHEAISGLSADGDGFAWISRARGDRPESYLWRWSAGTLRETRLDVPPNADAALVEWGSGQLALLYGHMDESSRVRVTLFLVDASDFVFATREVEVFSEPMRGFDGPRLTATPTSFGLVLTATLAWAGGAANGALSVVALNRDGDVIGRPFEHTDELGAGGTASVAATDGDVVVHHDITDHETTEALLFGCR